MFNHKHDRDTHASATIRTHKDKPFSSQHKKHKVRSRQERICQALLVKSFVAKVTEKSHLTWFLFLTFLVIFCHLSNGIRVIFCSCCGMGSWKAISDGGSGCGSTTSYGGSFEDPLHFPLPY